MLDGNAMSSAVPKIIPLNNSKHLVLKAKIHERIERFLKKEQQIFDLVSAVGSPLNIMFPQIIEENIAGFKKVYEDYDLTGRIYVSTKPNKSASVLRQASLQDVGIDVSSAGALKAALSAGFNPERIECTGPKNAEYLSLAIQQNAIINADNIQELQHIVDIRAALFNKTKTRVFVRLSGFYSQRMKFTPHDSTFGIHVDDTQDVFAFLKQYEAELDFQGFAFHFNSKVIEQKIIALENILQKTIEAMEQGFNPKGVNIGGGFDIRYADDPAQWKEYIENIKQSLRNFGPSLTWNDGGLGFRYEDGIIKGAPAYLDHGIINAGADELSSLLSLKLPSFKNMTVAEVISDCLLELYIEPGRAMFDQLGVTVGRVNHTKKSAHGENLVALDMNRSSINSSQQKLLTDPIIIYQDENRQPCPDGLYYVGNLCLSYDMLSYNKTFPDFMPEEGDLVVFINTASYIMDFVESETLYQNLAEKVAIVEEDDKFKWFMDQTYNPLSGKLGKRII